MATVFDNTANGKHCDIDATPNKALRFKTPRLDRPVTSWTPCQEGDSEFSEVVQTSHRRTSSAANIHEGDDVTNPTIKEKKSKALTSFFRNWRKKDTHQEKESTEEISKIKSSRGRRSFSIKNSDDSDSSPDRQVLSEKSFKGFSLRKKWHSLKEKRGKNRKNVKSAAHGISEIRSYDSTSEDETTRESVRKKLSDNKNFIFKSKRQDNEINAQGKSSDEGDCAPPDQQLRKPRLTESCERKHSLETFSLRDEENQKSKTSSAKGNPSDKSGNLFIPCDDTNTASTDFGNKKGESSVRSKLKSLKFRKTHATTITDVHEFDADSFGVSPSSSEKSRKKLRRNFKKSKKSHKTTDDSTTGEDDSHFVFSLDRKSSRSPDDFRNQSRKTSKQKSDKDCSDSESSSPSVIIEDEGFKCRRDTIVSSTCEETPWTILTDSSEQDEDFKITRKHQNFVEKKKWPKLKFGRQPKTKVTALSVQDNAGDDIKSEFPTAFWEIIEYDPVVAGCKCGEEGFINLVNLQNILADPANLDEVVVIDTRDYKYFIENHIIFAKHYSDFENAERDIMQECLFDVYSLFIMYDVNGKSLSLLDSVLSRLNDLLHNNGKVVYIIEGGIDRVISQVPYLCNLRSPRNKRIPSVLEEEQLYIGRSADFSLPDIIKKYQIGRVITHDPSVRDSLPTPAPELLIVKQNGLFQNWESIVDFILKGFNKCSQFNPKILITCEDADNESVAVVLGFLMFKHHWLLCDAYSHLLTQRKSIDINKKNFSDLQRIERKYFGKVVTKTLAKGSQTRKQPKDSPASEGKDGSKVKTLSKREKKKAREQVEDDNEDDVDDIPEKSRGELKEQRHRRRRQRQADVDDCTSEEDVFV